MKTSAIGVSAALTLAFLLLPSFGTAQTATPATKPIPVTSAESPEIRELQKVEDAWATALNTRDQYGLELVLSPLFVDVSATGDITTRNQQVSSLINQEDKTANIDLRVITVRMLGDVVVANGTYDWKHKVGSSEMEEKGVFTHVFQRLHGNWVCINAQRTALREEAPGNKVRTKSKSQAELPFHIPLFSKGDKTKDQ